MTIPASARPALTEEQVETLIDELQNVVTTWKDPGPMGTVYAMNRAISEAQRVLAAARSPRATEGGRHD